MPVVVTNIPAEDLQDKSKYIEFTQYLRPDGRKAKTYTAVPDGYGDKVLFILNSNCAFEAEVLGTGIVSLTVTDHTRDFAIELCPNGPEVLEAVKKLIDGAYRFLMEPKATEDEE